MIELSKLVKEVKFKEFVSGENSPSNTLKWKVNGTDLGIPCYSKKEDALWLFFGDTFDTPFPAEKAYWRGTVIGKVKDYNFSNHMIFDSFVEDEKGYAKNLIIHHKSTQEEFYERTKICQGAIEVNGVMYAFYESIRYWGEAGFWDVNYSGVIKSTDGGKTWERVYDLTWADLSQPQYTDRIKELAEQDTNLVASGYNLDLSTHNAPAFGQMYPVDGKDGYIYIYGRHGGRQYGIVVGRVKYDQIEDFSSYEYLVDSNYFVWEKGEIGLKMILENEEKALIIPKPVSNMSVAYNEYFGKWMLFYYKPAVGIVACFADTPYGKFSEPETLIPCDIELPCGKYLYGAFTHELLFREKGKRIYVIISQWNSEIYGSELFEVTFN